ncbi:MAG: hypothetical protein AAFO07_11805 [Bacteroidota bacterium]
MLVRSLFTAVLIISVGLLFTSCNDTSATSEEDATTEEVTDNQAEIEKAFDDLKEDYHLIMAETFHPAEEGNLEPLKTRYAELASKSTAWNDIIMPNKYKENGLDKSLALLSKESKEIGDLVKSGATDEELTKAISALHDRFHEIQGKCDH